MTPASRPRRPACLAPLLLALALPAQTVGELQRKLRHPDAGERTAAAVALARLGPAAAAAAPALGALLDDPTATVRDAAADALGSIGKKVLPLLEKALGDRATQVAALRAAGKLGKDGAPLVPTITKLWFQDDLVTNAAIDDCLKAIGAAATPHLIPCLKNIGLATSACYAMRKMGKDVQAATPALLELLGRKGLHGRAEAADVLAAIGDPVVVPALVEQIELSVPGGDGLQCNVAGHCARGLGTLGPAAAAGLPVLLRVLDTPRKDPDFVLLQGQTLMALGDLGRRSPDVLAALQRFAATASGENQKRARELADQLELGPGASDAALNAGLCHRSEELRRLALERITSRGAAAEPFLSAVVAMVEHEMSAPVKIAAIGALVAIGKSGPEVTKALLGASKHPDAQIAAAAEAALAALAKRSR